MLMSSLALPPIDRVRDRAHRAAIGSGIPAITAELQGVLGQALISVIVGKNVRTVARWVVGTTTKPSARDERRLRDTLQVQRLLLSVESAAVVRAWFMGMNPQLDDQSPAEALAEGRAREAMAAARAFVDAG
jgi:hypothetical protein